MQYTTTVTQRGQISLPKSLRDLLNIGLYQKVVLEAEQDYIKVIPTSDVLDMVGAFQNKVKTRANATILDARKELETKYDRP
jgi:AbrB family looped-hinge helix DNA binding protein